MQYSNSEETEGERQEYERHLSGQEPEGEYDAKVADKLLRQIEHEL